MEAGGVDTLEGGWQVEVDGTGEASGAEADDSRQVEGAEADDSGQATTEADDSRQADSVEDGSVCCS